MLDLSVLIPARYQAKAKALIGFAVAALAIYIPMLASDAFAHAGIVGKIVLLAGPFAVGGLVHQATNSPIDVSGKRIK